MAIKVQNVTVIDNSRGLDVASIANAGITDLRGNVTVGPEADAKITLDASDGSGSFDGNVLSNGFHSTELVSNGFVQVSHVENEAIIRRSNGIVKNDPPTLRFTDTIDSGAHNVRLELQKGDFYDTKYDFTIKYDGPAGDKDLMSFDQDGSAEFAGDVEVGNFGQEATDKGIRLEEGGTINAKRSEDSQLAVYRGLSIDGTITFDVLGNGTVGIGGDLQPENRNPLITLDGTDGSASFAGNIDSDGNISAEGTLRTEKLIQSVHDISHSIDGSVNFPPADKPFLTGQIGSVTRDQNLISKALAWYGAYGDGINIDQNITTSTIDWAGNAYFAGLAFFGGDVTSDGNISAKGTLRTDRLIQAVRDTTPSIESNPDTTPPLDRPVITAQIGSVTKAANNKITALPWLGGYSNGTEVDLSITSTIDWAGNAYFAGEVEFGGKINCSGEINCTSDNPSYFTDYVQAGNKALIGGQEQSHGIVGINNDDGSGNGAAVYARNVDTSGNAIVVCDSGIGGTVLWRVNAVGTQTTRKLLLEVDADDDANFVSTASVDSLTGEETTTQVYNGTTLDVGAVLKDLQQRVADRDAVISAMSTRLANLEAEHATMMGNNNSGGGY